MVKTLEIFTDGACSGNPGEAGIGVVITEHGKVVKQISQPIGKATNNIAEYVALIYALQEALMLKADQLKISTDSLLMCNQINGSFKIKNENLKIFNDLIQHLLKGFKKVEITHVLREKNQDADKLAVQAIKKEQAKTVAPLFDNFGEESPSSIG